MTVTRRVSDLVAEGILLVEDGNHGEYRPRPHEFVARGVPYIRAADMSSGTINFQTAGKIDNTARARIRKGVGQAGDVLLSHKGTVGKVAVAPLDAPDYVCSPQTTFWRSLDSSVLEQRFLPYVLKSAAFVGQLAYLMGQTDMAPYVSLTDQRSILIPVPAIAEQRGIAEVLGALDDKIATNRRAEAIAETLIAALHSRATATGAAQVPLMDAVDITFGEPFSGSAFAAPGVGRPLIRIRDLKTYTSQVWTTEIRERECVIRAGDVVVGMDAEFRATWWLGDEGLLNQRVCKVVGRGFGPALAREVMKPPLARVEGYKTGTTVIHLNKGDLQREVVVLPKLASIAQFESAAEPVLAYRVALAQERRSLEAIRDALLPELMSGRIRVKDAERVVEDVV